MSRSAVPPSATKLTVWGDHEWPGLGTVGSDAAAGMVRGEAVTEIRNFIMGEKRNLGQFLNGVQAHWAVENGLHRVLDVTMNENILGNQTGPGRRV